MPKLSKSVEPIDRIIEQSVGGKTLDFPHVLFTRWARYNLSLSIEEALTSISVIYMESGECINFTKGAGAGSKRQESA